MNVKSTRKHAGRSNFKRTQAVALPAMFVASAMVIFYLVKVPADYAQKRVNGAHEKPLARISITQSPALNQIAIGLRPPNSSSITRLASSGKQNAEANTSKAGRPSLVSTPNGLVRLAAEAGFSRALSRLQAKTVPIAHSTGSANPSKKWSVQISAAPAKDIADGLVQRLMAKGYDSYLVQAEVKGQTYYRVRVGHFAARDQAESVRQSLVHQEEYRDAYITGD